MTLSGATMMTELVGVIGVFAAVVVSWGVVCLGLRLRDVRHPVAGVRAGLRRLDDAAYYIATGRRRP